MKEPKKMMRFLRKDYETPARILIADDDEPIPRMIERLLFKWGHIRS